MSLNIIEHIKDLRMFMFQIFTYCMYNSILDIKQQQIIKSNATCVHISK